MAGSGKTLLGTTLAAAFLLAGPASAFERRVPEGFFGISSSDLLAMTQTTRLDELERHLAELERTGIDFLRTSSDWRHVELAPPTNGVHTYDWRRLDTLVAALASRGISWYPDIHGAPTWAETPGAAAAGCDRRAGVDPAHASDLGAFTGALVDRYGRAGSFWDQRPDLPAHPVTSVELWNEPNWTGFWCPTPDPEAYAEVAAAGAISARAADPRISLALGGLVPLEGNAYWPGGFLRGIDAGDFMRRAVTHAPQLGVELDEVAAHPYAATPDGVLAKVARFRGQMDAAGLGDKRLVLNEFGWTTQGGGPVMLSEPDRAIAYTEVIDALSRSDCDLSALSPHTWATPETDPTDPQHWFGLASYLTAVPYPSALAYVEQIALFEGRGPTAPSEETEYVCGEPPPPEPEPTPDPAPAPGPAPPTVSPNPPSRPPSAAPAPVLDLLAKPRGKVKARTLRIPYEVAGAPGTEVEYRHDDSGWRATRRSPLVLRRLDPGRHALALRAIDAAGRVSPRVTVRFRVVAG